MNNTNVTSLFNIKYPIFCAPMFLTSNENMVVATSNAGGLGTFPALNYRTLEAYRSSIQQMKKQTKNPIGVNIVVEKNNRLQEGQLEIALEEGVELIITSLGNPKEIIHRARKTKTKVFCDVVGLTHAKKVEDLGADGIIAVSYGAGGHAGSISPFALIPYLKSHIKLPLLAAGGITDGRTMLAALSLGADGVYLGTRFIASEECSVSIDFKEAILKAGPEDILNTDQVDGFPGNFIRTPRLIKMIKDQAWIETLSKLHPRLKRTVSLFRFSKILLNRGAEKISYKNVFSAGHSVALIQEVLPIEEIIQNMIKEYEYHKSLLP